jgi:hypothetical protein
MKESKFIELLNVYIDHQISPENATLLEHEILRDPRRKEIYSQYCPMHRACTIAFNQSQPSGATLSPPVEAVEFRSGARARLGYYAAGLAAAACLAIVVVRTAVRPGVAAAAHTATPAPQAPALASSAQATAAPTFHIDYPRSYALPKTGEYFAQRLGTSGIGDVASLTTFSPDLAPFSVSMVPVSTVRTTARPSIEEFVFATDSAVQGSPNLFRIHQPGDKPEESNAIEFQR